LLLLLAVAIAFLGVTPHPLDDHFHYQRFIEALAQGRIDLTIPGFHGSDFLSVIVHLLTGSAISQIYAQIIFAIFLLPVVFAAAKVVYEDEESAVALMLAVAMMPFVLFAGLRGWTGASFALFFFSSVACAKRFPWLSGVFLALAITTKPFAIGLIPLLLWIQRDALRWRRWLPVLTGMALAGIYVALQYVQAGHIIVGAHADLNQSNIFQGPERIALNIAHAVQILFSVHNYYFPDPSLTGAGNMMHTTPVFVFLALLALLVPAGSSKVPFPRLALLYGAAVSFGLNALLDHMDHYYMEAGLYLLILAAIPVMMRSPVWIPVAFGTLHFQWLYFFLEFRELYSLHPLIFIIPITVDLLLALLWFPRIIAAIVDMVRTPSS
jgi:hypothetical protein